MVGIPRSQGCKACRRKKKGCDLKRPNCGQCERLNVPCYYEEQRWTFVAQRRPKSDPEPAADGLDRQASQELRTTVTDAGLVRQQCSLRRTILEIQIDEAFWSSYMPHPQTAAKTAIGGIVAAPWVETLRFMASQDPTARLAMDACALMALGRCQDDDLLTQRGMSMYGFALHKVNQTLQYPRLACSDGVLAACRILGMCEIFRSDESSGKVSTRGTDWQRHVEGTVKLVQLRGADQHVDGHTHQLFVEARVGAAVSAITRRREAPLSDTVWNTVPWTLTKRTLKDDLVDIMLVISRLLPLQDRIFDDLAMEARHVPGSMGNSSEDVLSRCKRVDEALHRWEEKTLLLCAEASSREESLRLEHLCMSYGYGFFDTIMRYWFTRLILSSRTWLLFRRISQTTPNTLNPATSPGTLPDLPDPQGYASNIATNCHHYFDTEAGLYGAQHASLPMGGALHYYAATGQYTCPETVEMRRVLREYKTARFTSGFLRSIAADPAPAHVKGDTANRQDHMRMAAHWFGTARG